MELLGEVGVFLFSSWYCLWLHQTNSIVPPQWWPLLHIPVTVYIIICTNERHVWDLHIYYVELQFVTIKLFIFRRDSIRWIRSCRFPSRTTMIWSLRAVICTTWTGTGCSIHTVSSYRILENLDSLRTWTVFLLQVKQKKERRSSSFSATEIRLSWNDCVPPYNKYSHSLSLSVIWSIIQFTYATDVFNNKKQKGKTDLLLSPHFFSLQRKVDHQAEHLLSKYSVKYVLEQGWRFTSTSVVSLLNLWIEPAGHGLYPSFGPN